MAERGREGKSDIDRFLAEIDRLRKKSQGATAQPTVAKAKAKPVVAKPVEAKARPRLEMTQGATIPTVAGTTSRPTNLDAIPTARPISVASPVTPRGSVRVEAPEATVQTVRTVVAAGQMSQKTITPFARQLSALLAGKQSVPMAIVLTEIFGPPKSRSS